MHVVRTLTNKVLEATPHTDIFVTLGRSHTINRLSRLPSVALLFMGFRAIPVPVTGDDPVQNLGAIRRLPWYNVCRQRPLVFAPTDYCKSTGDKAPLKPWMLQALALLHIHSIRACR